MERGFDLSRDQAAGRKAVTCAAQHMFVTQNCSQVYRAD